MTHNDVTAISLAESFLMDDEKQKMNVQPTMTNMTINPQILFNEGYALAIKYGYKKNLPPQAHEITIAGFARGIQELFSALPPPVASLIHHVINYPSLRISFVIPALPSRGRRSVHLLLAREVLMKRVTVFCDGAKQDVFRPMRIGCTKIRSSA